jgi:hypothetical protein
MMDGTDDKTRATEETLGELHKELARSSPPDSGYFLRAPQGDTDPSRSAWHAGVVLPFEGSEQTH